MQLSDVLILSTDMKIILVIFRRNEAAHQLDVISGQNADRVEKLVKGIAYLSYTNEGGFDDPALAKFNVPVYQQIVALVKDDRPANAGDKGAGMDVSGYGGIHGIDGRQMSAVIHENRADGQAEQEAVNDIAKGLPGGETKQGDLVPASKNIISIAGDLLGSINGRILRIIATKDLLEKRTGLTDATERMRVVVINKMETGLQNLNKMRESLAYIIDSTGRSPDAERMKRDMDTVLKIDTEFRSTEGPADHGFDQARALIEGKDGWRTALARRPHEPSGGSSGGAGKARTQPKPSRQARNKRGQT